MNYKILEGSTSHFLSTKVQEHLDDGWNLYGFPIVSLAGAGTQYRSDFRETFIQAVIKADYIQVAIKSEDVKK